MNMDNIILLLWWLSPKLPRKMLSTVYPDSVLMLEKFSIRDEEGMSGSEAMGGQRVVVSCWVTADSEPILL